MGPDAALFEKPLLLLFADKTTTRKDRSVDTRDTWKNLCTTDICSIWPESNEARRAFRKYICEQAKNGELKGVIHIHNVFPSASRQTRSFFKPGLDFLITKPLFLPSINHQLKDAPPSVNVHMTSPSSQTRRKTMAGMMHKALWPWEERMRANQRRRSKEVHKRQKIREKKERKKSHKEKSRKQANSLRCGRRSWTSICRQHRHPT